MLLAVAMLGGARLAAGADEKPGKSPEKRFARADKNGDKKLTLEEFVGKRQDEKKEKAVKRFGRLDKDNDEFLSLEEFMAGIKKKNK
ncbi:MAG: EF-hand domain-containing protein [Planctomycetota bacterium]|nr:MAG: EF-hand domain-containing protein [Planctomycetota bacterium]